MYDLAGRIERAVIETHFSARIIPQCIVIIRAIKGGICEFCGFIAPVEGLAKHGAIFNDGIVCTDKAEVIPAFSTIF